MHLIAYNLIRCVMQKAALIHRVGLQRLSFKGCLDTVRQFASTIHGDKHKSRIVSSIIDDTTFNK